MIHITETLLHQWSLPEPDPVGSKEGRGRLVLAGGSVQLPGAIILAGLAALRSGAGKVQIATPTSIAPTVAAAILEGRVFAMPESEGGVLPEAADALLQRAEQANALAIGPGIVDTDATAGLLRQLLPRLNGLPTILDAEALTALKQIDDAKQLLGPHVIITPHAGEMATLLEWEIDKVTSDPPGALQEAQDRYGVTVVLKGAKTYIAEPGGKLYMNDRGTIGLATGGSGDVLAGLMGGLLARGALSVQAAVWAVSIHAHAGERLASRIGPLGFLARELVSEIPGLLQELGNSAKQKD